MKRRRVPFGVLLAGTFTVALALPSTSLLGQTPTCNWDVREAVRTYPAPAYIDCAQVGIDINAKILKFGLSMKVTVPSKCIKDGVTYSGIVYTCKGVNTSAGNHCIARGNKVCKVEYSGGSCPTVPRSKQQLLDAIKNGLIQCKAKEKRSFDWSAAVRSCPNGVFAPGGFPHGTIWNLYKDGDYQLAWHRSPDALLTTGTKSPFAGASIPTEIAPNSLPALLASTYEAQGAVDGADLTLTISVDYHDRDRPQAQRVSGVFSADGRFNAKVALDVDRDGVRSELTRLVSFDGTNLFDGADNNEARRIMTPSAHQYAFTLGESAGFAIVALNWLRGPLPISLMASTFDVDPNSRLPAGVTRYAVGSPAVLVTQTYAQDPAFADRTVWRFYFQSVENANRLVVADLFAGGRLLRRHEFAASRRFGTTQRPFLVVTTEFDPGGTQSRTTTLTVSAAHPLVAPVRVPRIRSSKPQRWLIQRGNEVTALGGRCGDVGYPTINGRMRIGNSGFSIGLVEAPSGTTTAVLMMGTNPSLATTCGPCTIMAAPFIQLHPVRGGSSHAPIPIPNDSRLVGVRMTWQWAVQANGGCAILPKTGFTQRMFGIIER